MAEGKRWLTYDEAAERIGRDRSTIYRWIAAGVLVPQMRRIHVDQLIQADHEKRKRRSPPPKAAGGVGALAAELEVDPAALAQALRQIAGGRGVSRRGATRATPSV